MKLVDNGLLLHICRLICLCADLISCISLSSCISLIRRIGLLTCVTALAEAQPRHRVVPYLNLPKKDYPMSRPGEEERA